MVPLGSPHIHILNSSGPYENPIHAFEKRRSSDKVLAGGKESPRGSKAETLDWLALRRIFLQLARRQKRLNKGGHTY